MESRSGWQLNDQEQRILQLLLQGWSAPEIGDELGYREEDVRWAIGTILRKVDVRNVD